MITLHNGLEPSTIGQYILETASHALLSDCISRIGIPSVITADRCVQFEFALCQNLMIMNLLCTNILELLGLSNTLTNNRSWIKVAFEINIRSNKAEVFTTGATGDYIVPMWNKTSQQNLMLLPSIFPEFSSTMIKSSWILFPVLTNWSHLCSNFTHQL